MILNRRFIETLKTKRKRKHSRETYAMVNSAYYSKYAMYLYVFVCCRWLHCCCCSMNVMSVRAYVCVCVFAVCIFIMWFKFVFDILYPVNTETHSAMRKWEKMQEHHKVNINHSVQQEFYNLCVDHHKIRSFASCVTCASFHIKVNYPTAEAYTSIIWYLLVFMLTMGTCVFVLLTACVCECVDGVFCVLVPRFNGNFNYFDDEVRGNLQNYWIINYYTADIVQKASRKWIWIHPIRPVLCGPTRKRFLWTWFKLRECEKYRKYKWISYFCAHDWMADWMNEWTLEAK